MAQSISSRPRVTVDGKFFRRGAEKIFIKGVTYGPFAPDVQGETFASPEKTACDFTLIRELGVNLLRVYNAPPRWFLDLAAQNDLLLLVDVSWFSPRCPINPAAAREAARPAAAPISVTRPPAAKPPAAVVPPATRSDAERDLLRAIRFARAEGDA